MLPAAARPSQKRSLPVVCSHTNEKGTPDLLVAPAASCAPSCCDFTGLPAKERSPFSLKLPVHAARSFLLSFYSGELRKPQHAFMRFSSSFKILFTTAA